MKSILLFATALSFIFVGLFSCLNEQQKEEHLARQTCGSCHEFPDPGLLDKKTWDKSVLPQMAFRMGIASPFFSTIPANDQLEVLGTLPGQPLVDEIQWESIKNYFITHSPDSLAAPVAIIDDTVDRFTIETYALLSAPLITFVKTDTVHHKLYVGSRLNKLYRFNTEFVLEDSFTLSSPPSQMRFPSTGDPELLLMGIMDPNDQPKGSLSSLHEANHVLKKRIDSLKRPVYFENVDLDKDGLEDVVICAFGNYSGELVTYKNLGDGKFKKIVLQSLPGARKVILRDVDNNGMVDIVALMSQGDEKIIALMNQGDFNFRINTLLRFPPVYGSSYFELADFNQDGYFDILYTNGDNADYSTILKPYHGVRIFLNNGKNDFTESWFYNMHGASQAVARDFDGDGDLDIAAISFFPPFREQPGQGFIYFENSGGKFIPQTISEANKGRWLTLEVSDIDRDGDDDLLLGALNFSNGVPEEIVEQWKKENISILVLRNKTY